MPAFAPTRASLPVRDLGDGPDGTPRPRRRARLVALAVALTATALAPSTAAADPPPADPSPEVLNEPVSRIFVLSGNGAEPTAPATGRDRAARVGPRTAGPGWSASLDVADGSHAVAASWSGHGAGTVAVRGLGPTGWTEWYELEGQPDERPDASGRTATPIVWFGTEGIDQAQLRVVDGELTGLELQAVRSPVRAGDAAAADPARAAPDGRPTINPRSTWATGGWIHYPDCTPTPEPAVDGLKFAVVHHTVSANPYARADVPAMIRSVYAFHTGTNRWCDLGYNLIVDRFGRIWEGRSGGIAEPIIGGHSKGFNTGSVGVALLGQHQPGASPAVAHPTNEAVTAVGQVIGWKLALHNVSATTTVRVVSKGSPKYPEGAAVTLNRVSGHRHVGLTSCPGDHAFDRLATIRSVATSYANQMPAPPAATAPFRLPGSLVTQQFRDVLHRLPSVDRYRHWSQQIVSGATTPGQLITTMVQSGEADELLHAVTRLYRAYFLRNPDHNGFTYWITRRVGGVRLGTISEIFARSSEFQGRYGQLSDEEFIDLIYRNVLERTPDSGGRTYWTGRLASGTARGEVMTQFSQASEYVRKTKRGNEIVALYETMLKRAVTDSSYATLLADGRPMDAIATSLFVSNSYKQRFATRA